MYTAASDAGFTVSDLTELVTRFDNAISRNDVSNFFANAGLDPSAMAPSPTEPAPDDGTASGSSTIRTNDQGLLVIEPQGPLTDEQKLFIGGLTEAKLVSFTFRSEEDDRIASSTPEGHRVNVAFGDQDFPDIVFDISSAEFESAEEYVDPLADQVFNEAIQQLGLSRQEVAELFPPDTTVGNLTDAQGQGFVEIRTAQQSIINEAIQPMYEALLAGESEIWG